MQPKSTLHLLVLPLLLSVSQADNSKDARSVVDGGGQTHHVRMISEHVFDPQTITAKPGDRIDFHLPSGIHGIAQSDYEHPCVPLAGGISSGEVENPSEYLINFYVPINDTNPVWIYSSVKDECREKGATMVINPPGPGRVPKQSLEDYIAAAKQLPKEPSSPTASREPAIAGVVLPRHHDNDTASNGAEARRPSSFPATLPSLPTRTHTTATPTTKETEAVSASSHSRASKGGSSWTMMVMGLTVAMFGML